MTDCYTTSTASPGFQKDEKSDGLVSVKQPNSLAFVTPVNPKTLIPIEVIKSLPITEILFNYQTLKRPNF